MTIFPINLTMKLTGVLLLVMVLIQNTKYIVKLFVNLLRLVLGVVWK